jgi:hypothetical protein
MLTHRSILAEDNHFDNIPSDTPDSGLARKKRNHRHHRDNGDTMNLDRGVGSQEEIDVSTENKENVC